MKKKDLQTPFDIYQGSLRVASSKVDQFKRVIIRFEAYEDRGDFLSDLVGVKVLSRPLMLFWSNDGNTHIPSNEGLRVIDASSGNWKDEVIEWAPDIIFLDRAKEWTLESLSFLIWIECPVLALCNVGDIVPRYFSEFQFSQSEVSIGEIKMGRMTVPYDIYVGHIPLEEDSKNVKLQLGKWNMTTEAKQYSHLIELRKQASENRDQSRLEEVNKSLRLFLGRLPSKILIASEILSAISTLKEGIRTVITADNAKVCEGLLPKQVYAGRQGYAALDNYQSGVTNSVVVSVKELHRCSGNVLIVINGFHDRRTLVDKLNRFLANQPRGLVVFLTSANTIEEAWRMASLSGIIGIQHFNATSLCSNILHYLSNESDRLT